MFENQKAAAVANENAPDSPLAGVFAAAVAKVGELAKTIDAAADDHFDAQPNEVSWAHVGTALWMRDELQRLVDVMQGNRKI